MLKYFTKYPVITGCLFGAINAFVILKVVGSQTVLSIVLAMIAGVYLGFAINDGRDHIVNIESAVSMAFVFYSAAILDRSFLPAFMKFLSTRELLAIGFVAHGIYDYLHHNDHLHRRHTVITTSIKPWYPVWCAWVDFAIAAVVYIW